MTTAPAWAPVVRDADPEVLNRPGRLPSSLYESRAVFAHIRQAAHAEGCSADVLFYSTLARLSGMISHHFRAVTGIGGRASLNIFSAVVGGSGAGKSTSSSLTRALMPAPDDEFRDGLPVGSGEGIAEAFMGTVEEETGEIRKTRGGAETPVTRRVRKQVRHNAFFYVDEGQTIAKLGERSGSVLGETLRRAAVGETLGQTNASEERTRYVPAGSYSLGLLVGFQPSTAIPVLADASTGTPQRFLWAWADDPAIPDEPPPWPGAIEFHPGRKHPAAPVDITFPDRIKSMLWNERVGRNRGEIEVSELDGHAGLIKVKLAALFALLENREYVTEEDWSLADVVWTASCGARDLLVTRAEREAAVERQRQEDAKVQQELRAHQAKSDADMALERVARLVRKHASQVGGVTWGELRRRLASRDRPVLEKAVDVAESRDWVFGEGDRICVRTES